MEPLALTSILAFKPCFRVEAIDPETVFLIAERERLVASGPNAARIAALVDGRRTVEQLRELAAGVSDAELFFSLSRWLARGILVLVTEGDAGATPASAFWYGAGLDAGALQRSLRERPVALRVLGDDRGAELLRESLEQAGVVVDPEAAVRVVVTDDYLHPGLAEIDAEQRSKASAWALVRLTGVRPLVGPLFEPRGPCWRCLSFWLRKNRPVEERVRHASGDGAVATTPLAFLPTSLRAAAGFSALVLARALSEPKTGGGSLRASLWSFDLASFQTQAHAVVARPQCPSCGDAGLTRAIGERRVQLQPVRKRSCDDGGFRQQSPRVTFEAFRHLVSPITGPVTYLVPAPGRDTDLRSVYASGYLVSPAVGTAFDKSCAGKGRSAEQSRASALCEALERFSGVFQGDEARVRGTAAELGAAALRPEEILNFSAAQYANRASINSRQTDRREWVPEPLPDDCEIDWSPAWSLTQDERRYVPFAYCYAEAPVECGAAYCQACGNGVAAGTCLEEAVLQGLLELVERDAAAVWWYNRVARPEIDLASFGDGYFDALRADYGRHGWSIWALDLTHDLEIPTCVALARDPETDRFAIGLGCHLDGRIAVQRALTEMNQIFDPETARKAPWDHQRVRSREFLFPNRDVAPVTASRFGVTAGADLLADIRECRARIERAGMDVVVVDKTRPDIGLAVAQVVVPGLRHFWPRLGAGRLYSVPVRLGWSSKPLLEGELNPVGLLI